MQEGTAAIKVQFWEWIHWYFVEIRIIFLQSCHSKWRKWYSGAVSILDRQTQRPGDKAAASDKALGTRHSTLQQKRLIEYCA